MGVQGLTTYVEGNRNFFQDVRFRDSRLVIDGCSLFFRLYFNHWLDQQHGGEYEEFALLLTQFLSALEACNIQPYVVMDGGIDPSDKKFPTICQRLQSKIKQADSLSHGRNGSVLPILTRPVFIQVLIQRRIPLVQCLFEADKEIACLAHQWNCPVLSNDSDFYIFDLPGGYLPLHFFQWTHLHGQASRPYISARRYTTAGLCRWFGGMNKSLLPLCAVLNGNDYGAPEGVKMLQQLIDANASKGRANSTSRVESILIWLSSFANPKEVLDEVSRFMRNDVNIHDLKTGLRAGAQGLLSSKVVDAVVMKRVILAPQVENCKLDSSHSCAKVLRQAIYGILLLRRQETRGTAAQENVGLGAGGATGRRGGGRRRGGRRGRRGGRGGRGRGQGTSVPNQLGEHAAASAAPAQVPPGASVCVEEYDRMDLNFKKNLVEARLPGSPVHLDTLDQASAAVRLCVFVEVLGIKESDLVAVPAHLSLAVAVTGFWLREARPPPSRLLLQALVLGLVYGEMSWKTQSGATHHRHATPPVNWGAERNVLRGLDRLRVRSGERRGLDVGAAHAFCQWQACLWSALCLNQLLLLPLPEPHLPGLFSGTLVHGLFRYLNAGQAAESLLPEGTQAAQLYCPLLAAATKCSSQIQQHSSAGARGKRGGQRRGRRRRGGRGACRGRRDSRDLSSMFAALMNDDESGEVNDL